MNVLSTPPHWNFIADADLNFIADAEWNFIEDAEWNFNEHLPTDTDFGLA